MGTMSTPKFLNGELTLSVFYFISISITHLAVPNKYLLKKESCCC